MNTKEITSDSLEEVLDLLKESKLPYRDIALGNNLFIGLYDEKSNLIACGGLEFYGDYALLRSVAVAPSQRGKLLGKAIVGDLIARGKSKTVKSIFLLTETAENFFLNLGFQRVDRMSVPIEVHKSSEFSSVCPISAACLVLHR